jgi:hypothetical protein
MYGTINIKITLRIQHDAREWRRKVGIHRELTIVYNQGNDFTWTITEYKPQILNFAQGFVNI